MKHPRVLGIDDAPFEKGQKSEVPLVGVVMEGSILVEGVAIRSFPVDGEGATEYLSDWIGGTRWHEALQAVLLGGAAIAGLGIVDICGLAGRLGLPVISVTRREPDSKELEKALRAAGLENRMEIVANLPPARQLRRGLFVAGAGGEDEKLDAIVRSTLHHSKIPEPIRIAHLIGAALVRGESRGRA